MGLLFSMAMKLAPDAAVPHPFCLYFTAKVWYATKRMGGELLKKFVIFDSMTTTSTPQHLGRKIARIRELRGMKQETLAEHLGISQQSVSAIEKSEKVEEEKLVAIAQILGVTKEAIENFSEEAAINFFNTFNDSVASSHFGHNYSCTFNPLDKLVEAYEENKKLYERLVQSEKDKVGYLEKLMKK